MTQTAQLTKIYRVTEKHWLLQAGRGMWIGSEFMDHGRWMRVTGVGVAFRPDGETRNLIDITAVRFEKPRENRKGQKT